MTRGRGLLTVMLAGMLLLSTALPALADSAPPPPPPPPGGGGGSSGGGSSGGSGGGGSSGSTSTTSSSSSSGTSTSTSTGSSSTNTTPPPATHHRKPKAHKKTVHKAKPKPPVPLPSGQPADHHAEIASSLPTVTAISTISSATVATPATPSSMTSDAVWIVVGAAAVPLVLIAAFAALRPSFRRRAAQRSRPVAR